MCLSIVSSVMQTKSNSYNPVMIFFYIFLKNLIEMGKFLQYLISLFLSLAALPNHPAIFWIFSRILPLLGRRLQPPLPEPLHGEVAKPHCQHLFLQPPSSCLAELKPGSFSASTGCSQLSPRLLLT